MPNRIIKESITTSATLAALSAEEERFFLRLTVVVDDYGRIDARPCILRAKCFAAMLARVSEQAVARWLAALARVGLIRCYVVDGHPYLELSTWGAHQITRAKRSKYPAPTDSCMQMPADASRCEQMPADVSGIGIRDPRSENVIGIGNGRATRAERQARMLPWPADFTLTPERIANATRVGADPTWEWDKFRDHHRAKGSRFVDWPAAWRTWLRNAVDFELRGRG